MRHRFLARWFALFGLVGATACSLLVDTSELTAQCGAGKKACEGKCVSVDEPFYGCDNGCTPCPGGEHIVHECDNGECIFVECQHGWGCTGCTMNLLTSPSHCGACNYSCPDGEGPAELGWTCGGGVCVSPSGERGVGGEGGGTP